MECERFFVRTSDGQADLCAYDFVFEERKTKRTGKRGNERVRNRRSCKNVIFAHCNGTNALAYLPIVERLQRMMMMNDDDVRVVMFDQRGHGRSTRVVNDEDLNVSWDVFAEDVGRVKRECEERDSMNDYDSKEKKQWHAFGHSLGAFSVLLLEAKQPGTFASVFAYEPIFALREDSYDEDDEEIKNLFEKVEKPDGSLQRNARKRQNEFISEDEAFRTYKKGLLGKVMDDRCLWNYVFNGGFKKKSNEGGEGVKLSCEPEVEARIYDNGGENADALAFIAERIECPVTIAIGGLTKQAYAYGVGKIAGKKIKTAKLIEFDSLGHFGPLTMPDCLADYLANYLAKFSNMSRL